MTEIQGDTIIGLLVVIEQGVRLIIPILALCAAALFGSMLHRWVRGS